jgi:hypothetical protein
MAATDARIDLRLWSVATFRTVSFVLVVALVFHLRGSLRERLATFDTLLGSVAFLLLWITTLLATRFERRCLERAEVDPHRDASPLEATIVAGAFNGVLVLAVASSAVILRPFASGHIGEALRLAPALVVFSVIGGLVAFTIGGFVGLAYGIVENLLGRVTARVLDTKDTRSCPSCSCSTTG